MTLLKIPCVAEVKYMYTQGTRVAHAYPALAAELMLFLPESKQQAKRYKERYK